MLYSEAAAIVSGASGFGWLRVNFDYDSAAWIATSDQGEGAHLLEATDRLAAQDEALAYHGKTAVGAWAYSGGDEEGSKVVIV